jgi:deazaflavin-dependent oxidoreductase (nitroreductase family)
MSPEPVRVASRPMQLRLIALGHRVVHRLTGGRYGSLEPGKHAPQGRVLKAITRVHLRLYAWTGGIVGGNAGGLPTLLLTTTGRKSGEARTVPLPYFTHGDAFLVVASFAGNAKDPAWYQNLVAHPGVRLQVRFRKTAARATVARGDERRALWSTIVASSPMYADYQRVTEREIPVVVLRPEGART